MKEHPTQSEGEDLLYDCQTSPIVYNGLLAYQEVSSLEDEDQRDADNLLDM